MSDDIKVGDVCVIVSPASADLIGAECEVVGEEKVYEKRISSTELCEVWAYCLGFLVTLTRDGRRYCIERICLRKKRPPAEDDADRLGDETPNQRVNWSQVPGYTPPTRVKEPA